MLPLLSSSSSMIDTDSDTCRKVLNDTKTDSCSNILVNFNDIIPILIQIHGNLSLTHTNACLKIFTETDTNTDTGLKTHTTTTTAYKYRYSIGKCMGIGLTLEGFPKSHTGNAYCESNAGFFEPLTYSYSTSHCFLDSMNFDNTVNIFC